MVLVPVPSAQHRAAGVCIMVVLASVLAAACAGGSGFVAPEPGSRASSSSSQAQQSASKTGAQTCAPVADPVQHARDSVVRIETPPDQAGEISAGTGFVVASDVVLTNQHVVAGVTRVRASFSDGRAAIGQIMSTNEAQDLALVLVDTLDIPPIIWGDDRTLSKGTPVWAIGFALDKPGPPATPRGAFQQTYVDPPTGQAYLVTDVRLDHGDSGGPLLNQCGQVVGVNTARIRGESRAGLSIPEYFAQRWASQQLQQHH